MFQRETAAMIWITALAVALTVGVAVIALTWPPVSSLGVWLWAPTAASAPTPAEAVAPTIRWVTEENAALGVRFRYPRAPQYLASFEGSTTWPIGEEVVEVRDAVLIERQQQLPHHQVFRLVLATAGLPQHDPCCGYAGPPLNFLQTDGQLAVAIASHLGPIVEFERTTVGGRPAVAFYHLESWDTPAGVWLWATRSYLLPSPRTSFTHLLLTGPALLAERIGYGGDDPTLRYLMLQQRQPELLRRLPPEPGSLPSAITQRQEIFEAMVRSVTFPAAAAVPLEPNLSSTEPSRSGGRQP